jgi:endogenous inhibitor of DNA gyrase (YacG/DUF329 family)
MANPELNIKCSLCGANWLWGIKDAIPPAQQKEWVCPNCEVELKREHASPNNPFGDPTEVYDIETEKELAGQ